MRQIRCLVASLLLLLCLPSITMAESDCVGFAQVVVDAVNVRANPEDRILHKVEAGAYVYVLGEQSGKDGQVWYQANVKVKNGSNLVGWIRGDMLLLMRDVFTDITKIAVGQNHVVGLKRNGTVVGMGEKFPGGFDPGALADWHDVVDIAAGTCTTIGINQSGRLLGTGNNAWTAYEVSDAKAVYMSGLSQVVLREDGSIFTGLDTLLGKRYLPQYGGVNALPAPEAYDLVNYEIFAITRGGLLALYAANGQDLGPWREVQAVSHGGTHRVILMKDGTVIANGKNFFGECDVSGWTDIVQVACGEFHTLGLKSDGTVVSTGLNKRGQCNVKDWRDIVQVEAGQSFSVALTGDGRVLMCGEIRFDYADEQPDAYRQIEVDWHRRANEAWAADQLVQ